MACSLLNANSILFWDFCDLQMCESEKSGSRVLSKFGRCRALPLRQRRNQHSCPCHRANLQNIASTLFHNLLHEHLIDNQELAVPRSLAEAVQFRWMWRVQPSFVLSWRERLPGAGPLG